MMLLPKQLRTVPHATQQPGQWAAHLTTAVGIPAACYTVAATLAPKPSHEFIKGKGY